MMMMMISSGHPMKGGPSACYEMLNRASELAGSCEYGNEILGSIIEE
jgi:hypothetical protein